jgi:hypothetical protein
MDEPRWQPPQRPAWVTLLNRVGVTLGSPAALVPLDEQSLLEAAKAATGLEDFGGDEWRKPFRILLADIENEANLTLAGRLLTRYDLVRSLIVRLQMAETEKRHPEILEQPVEAPIFITGMGRTGTSILYELMAQDPRMRATLGWELRFPGHDDRRIADVAAEIDLWLEVVPEFKPIHEMSAEGADEDVVGEMHEFMSQVFTATHRAPNYEAWLVGSGMAQAFRFHRRLLQHLQWKTPGRVIVKGPSHISCLPSLFAEYPDAQVIMTHRDPLKVMASTANMFATLRWQRSDRVNYAEIVQPLALGYPFLMDMIIQQRSTGVVPDDRFVDVRFADLMLDHLGTISWTYEQLGIDLTDEVADRMRTYLDAKPRARHGSHAYRFDDLGLDQDEMRTKFASYMKHFDIPEEQL